MFYQSTTDLLHSKYTIYNEEISLWFRHPEHIKQKQKVIKKRKGVSWYIGVCLLHDITFSLVFKKHYDTTGLFISTVSMNIENIQHILGQGNIIAIPTETVYGLAVDATNIQAVQKLFTVKGRPDNKPITIQVGNIADIEKYATIRHPREQKIIDRYMPGPITLILEKKPCIPDIVTAGSPFVGVRIPQHPDTLQLLQHINFPLAVPSANLSGETPATTAEEAEKIFREKVTYYMPNSQPISTLASTVVQIINGELKIRREGPISLEDIQNIL